MTASTPSGSAASRGEFALIRRYFAGLTPLHADIVLGIGDDCALLAPTTDGCLAVTTDTLVAGRHFPLDTAPEDIGWKALAVNLSDLAAMGAQPYAFTLALTLPSADEAWLQAFADGLGALALRAGIALVGGDTTRGGLSITITAMGYVPAQAALRRAGARPGDWICVTGTLGDAALALHRRAAEPRPAVAPPLSAEAQAYAAFLRQRLDRPQPRYAEGLALRGLAHAALDLSDGLAGDLPHVLRASGVGACIDTAALPMSAAFAALHPPSQRLLLQACGGDDYELCVCLPPAQYEAAQAQLGVPLTAIGEIVAEPGLRWLDAAGQDLPFDGRGFEHF